MDALKENLIDAAVAVRGVVADLERTTSRRDRLVTQALSQGWTHAQIAEATGLSRGRIGQLAQGDAREWRDNQLKGRKT